MPNTSYYKPTGTTGNGRCNNGECKQGEVNADTKMFNHLIQIARHPADVFRGEGASRKKNAMAQMWTEECGECLARFGPTCPIGRSMAKLSLGAQVPGTGLKPVERICPTRHCHCIQSTRTKRNAPNIKVQDQITVPGLSRVPEWYRP